MVYVLIWFEEERRVDLKDKGEKEEERREGGEERRRGGEERRRAVSVTVGDRHFPCWGHTMSLTGGGGGGVA